ncbi:MAG: glycosyltransferase [Alphaproteobacteria bacterium]|nr:glycosyltransferase [Alphaproteobacteria bacterium]
MRCCVAALVGLFLIRYLDWRLFQTVLPAEGSLLELGWIWLCFTVEAVALFDAVLLYVTFLRRADRRAEADRLEAGLRALPPERLPAVDVLIPSYNEPLEVLEKTIVGALSIDYPNFRVWVLDDGRRPWLRDFCREKGAGYITRPDNSHAKAGNINHALPLTDGEFIAIFDADFVPQRNFLMRTLGFFEDPRIGIVQVPHAFYNHDPMQTNLAVRKVLPDDQRFFFDAIMPSRDGWDAAFCCGSNSLTRRSALAEIGGKLPTDSITEDMLLTLVLLRRGYITRYLAEPLAFGLAPESIQAFFVQRQRWARGATQIMLLRNGPLGPGLKFVHRLLFLPTHWLTQSLISIFSLIVPLVFLWTGLAPLANVTREAILFYQIPAVLAVFGGLRVFAPTQYFPLAAAALGTFQSFKILPSVLGTLVSPRGHLFRVTPKGRDAAGAGYETGIFWICLALLAATALGLVVNARVDIRIVEQTALIPLVAFWSVVNILILLLVCMLCLQTRVRRGEERFEISEPVWLLCGDGTRLPARLSNLSLSGAAVRLPDGAPRLALGAELQLVLPAVGPLRASVARRFADHLGLRFELPPSPERDLLIRKIFTSGINTPEADVSGLAVTLGLLGRIFSLQDSTRSDMSPSAAETMDARPPAPRLPAETTLLPPGPPGPKLAEPAGSRAATGE